MVMRHIWLALCILVATAPVAFAQDRIGTLQQRDRNAPNGVQGLDANGFPSGPAASSTPVTTATYTALATDRDLCVAVNAPSTITLPATATHVYTVKDCAAHAATYPITVQVAGGGKIDGYDNVILTQNTMSLDFKYSGTAWGLR